MQHNGAAGAQRALIFFARAGLTRLLEKLRAKYIAEGQIRGQVILTDASLEERRELASFQGKPLYRDSTVKVKLAEMDQALRNSGFACSLLDVITALRPNEPLETSPERRAARALYQADFHQALLSIASALPEHGHGHTWLLHGVHGLAWLFSRYKNATAAEQKRQLAIVRYVAGLLDQLPDPANPDRLALFAQRTSGDPHTLDPDQPEGRLFLLALSDLFADAAPVQDRAHALRLYSQAGLLVDTVSSSVAVFHLAGATLPVGDADPLLQAAGARVLLLPQRQLLEWSQIQPARTHIYGIENPQVFEEVVDDLLRHDRHANWPTLICTAGWPSVAVHILLDQVLAASPENRLYYSGDFDLRGLQIAAHLLARYPERCVLWRFDAQSYTHALQSEGVPAPASELDQLNALPAVFAPLVAVMRGERRWGYQEGIVRVLVRDVLMDVT